MSEHSTIPRCALLLILPMLGGGCGGGNGNGNGTTNDNSADRIQLKHIT